tara:strand:- start:58058 stop:58729 length:672 start_codon:yes stop_codon:yes gene_type:complete
MNNQPVGFKAACLFKSFQLHFNQKTDYNAIAYHFKVSMKEDTFLQSKFRWKYSKLEKNSTPTQLIFLFSKLFVDGDLKPFNEKALFNKIHKELGAMYDTDTLQELLDKFYIELEKDLHNLTQTTFTNVKNQYRIDSYVEADGVNYPLLYEAHKDGIISYYTLLLIDLYMTPNMNGVINKERSKDIIMWDEFVERSDLVKQVLYVALDETRIYEIFRSLFKETQ